MTIPWKAPEELYWINHQNVFLNICMVNPYINFILDIPRKLAIIRLHHKIICRQL